MYLREMGSVELLSRAGELAIAKRIEAGRDATIAGLCESPLDCGWHALMVGVCAYYMLHTGAEGDRQRDGSEPTDATIGPLYLQGQASNGSDLWNGHNLLPGPSLRATGLKFSPTTVNRIMLAACWRL
jgi:hypothetical protein